MSRLRNGQSMIGTLVALVVLIGAALFYFTGGFGSKEPEEQRPDGKGNTIIGGARYAAEDSVCKTQLRQIRQMIQVDMDPVDDVYPAALSSIRGVSRDYETCPIDDEPYDYDPTTGEISCPHPGHEEY